jgi:lipopolysaccharide assembly outer membrane protein LptD (OstA)
MLFLASANSLQAVSLQNFKPDNLKKIQADSWDVDGKNIVVKGNVCLPGENSAIYADTAIINAESKDFEAIGNVRFYSWTDSFKLFPPQNWQTWRGKATKPLKSSKFPAISGILRPSQ